MSVTHDYTILRWKGYRFKLLQVIHDDDYGDLCSGFLNHEKVYIIDGKIVVEQVIIDHLDNKYGIPVAERGIDYD